MLGEWISDSFGVEGGGEIRGMGLLPVSTLLREEKQRSQITGRVWDASQWKLLQGIGISGYEIHMGESVYGKNAQGVRGTPFSILADGREDGCVQGRVLGTYLHGIFESTEFTQRMLEQLCLDRHMDYETLLAETSAGEKGLSSYQAYKETQYDLLADAVRKHLDMEKIYEIIGI